MYVLDCNVQNLSKHGVFTQQTHVSSNRIMRAIDRLETKADKLMLTRNNDFIMAGGKFPRLTKTSVKARLNEIKRLLQSLR